MEKRTKIIIGSVAAVLVIGGTAIAANGYNQKNRGMSIMRTAITEADTNSDKAISKEELSAALDKRFAEIDGDSNSRLTRAEVITGLESLEGISFVTRRAGRITDRVFQQLDIDADGAITRSEVENRAGKFFAVLDFNDDGKVDRTEARKMRMYRGGRGWGHRWRGGRNNENDG